MNFKIKKKDKVVVISGREKGKVGEVVEVIAGDRFTPTRVVVSKLNMVTKNKKPTQTDPGGMTKIEAPLAMCNVMLVDPKTNKPTRVRMKRLPSGEKTRVAIKSGEMIA
ncbi:MAG: 50S ribosomal protein L24 [Elusimicrobiota bacterium]